MLISGSSAIITGGARGLGKAFAETLLQNGAKVCLVDILDEVLTITCEELQKKKCCISGAFSETLARFNGIDIVINNAGLQKEGKWETMLDVNLSAVIQGTLLSLGLMDANRGGTVVNIASDVGVDVDKTDTPLIPVYTASKAAVVAYTRCFALNPEVVSRKIRLLCLCPRLTDTALAKDHAEDRCWDVKAFQALDLESMMRPEEVAHILLTILRDDGNNGKIALVSNPDVFQYV